VPTSDFIKAFQDAFNFACWLEVEKLTSPIADTLKSRILEAAQEQKQRCKIKAIVSRAEGRASYPTKNSPADILVFVSDLPERNYSTQGLALEVCPEPLVLHSGLAGLKLLNRSHYIFSMLQASVSEPLFVNEQGHIIEAMHHNIFLINDQEIITPDLSKCGVAGVARQIIIEKLAPSLGLSVELKDIFANDLHLYCDAFVCNAIDGPIKVSAIETT
jgi:4-amino-4-deoxychorismate lyase